MSGDTNKTDFLNGEGVESSSPPPQLTADTFDPSVTFVNKTNIDAIRAEGGGKAYQSVAGSMAIATQDATDNLRNFSTVNTTALSYAQEQLLQTKDVAVWGPIIAELQTALDKEIQLFSTLGMDTGKILKSFPSGEESPESSGEDPSPSPLRAGSPPSEAPSPPPKKPGLFKRLLVKKNKEAS